MPMTPFFPSLRPPIANRIWFDVNAPVSDEAEILRYERNHHAWLESIKNAAMDIYPYGKVLTIPGPETDDEDANDDSDETDNSEDEDTNDRTIPGPTDRTAAIGTYSPAGDDITSAQEDAVPSNIDTSQN